MNEPRADAQCDGIIIHTVEADFRPREMSAATDKRAITVAPAPAPETDQARQG